jgi:hypothetical protein
MTTKINVIFDNPESPQDFESAYPDMLAQARKIPGVLRVDQRGIPVVEIPTEVLEEHQGRRPLADLAIHVVDPVRCFDRSGGSRQVGAGGR